MRPPFRPDPITPRLKSLRLRYQRARNQWRLVGTTRKWVGALRTRRGSAMYGYTSFVRRMRNASIILRSSLNGPALPLVSILFVLLDGMTLSLRLALLI